MNFINQAKGALGGGGQNQAGQAGQQGGVAGGAPGQAGGATGQQDALDKGVGSVLNSAGHGQNAATTEKISDGVRSAFKSGTGRDVPIQDKQ